jgi:hypothetical protein
VIDHQEQFETDRVAVSQKTGLTMSLMVFAWLLALQTVGCGGSAGIQNNPPPPPTFTTIDAPDAGPEGTFALGINASSEVVGYIFDANNTLHSFIRNSAGTATTFDPPGVATQQGLGSEAVGINGSGTVVGFFADQQFAVHGFTRTSSGTITVFDPPASLGTYAF